jgi:carboxylesterase
MWLKHLSREPEIYSVGRRIELHADSPTAVLALHGWKGWTGRLAYLAGRLHEAGFTVIVPRLPGHGTSMNDMRTTGAHDWIRCAVDEYLDLAARHERVLVTGHSMGAILATILAAQYGVERIALLAPAHKNRNRLLPLTPLVRPFIRRITSNWKPEMEDDAANREIGIEYATYDYMSMAAELYKVQRLGNRLLPGVTSRILVAVSESDEAVPPSVSEWIKERSNAAAFRQITVRQSNHQVAEHVDRQEVADAVVDWFTRP